MKEREETRERKMSEKDGGGRRRGPTIERESQRGRDLDQLISERFGTLGHCERERPTDFTEVWGLGCWVTVISQRRD